LAPPQPLLEIREPINRTLLENFSGPGIFSAVGPRGKFLKKNLRKISPTFFLEKKFPAAEK
jgi:hypothetical protein